MFYKYTSTQPFPNFYCWCLFTAFSFGELCTILIMSITNHVFLFAESGSTKQSLVNLSSWLHLVSICWEFSCLSSHSDIVVDGHYLYLCGGWPLSIFMLSSCYFSSFSSKLICYCNIWQKTSEITCPLLNNLLLIRFVSHLMLLLP